MIIVDQFAFLERILSKAGLFENWTVPMNRHENFRASEARCRIVKQAVPVLQRQPHSDQGSISRQQDCKAFTLVELLAVVGVMTALMALLIPAVASIKGAADVTADAYGISDVLVQARSYAMANNTFVFVGIAEVDSSVSSSATPQITSSASPYGRVAVAVVASKDGQPGYDTTNSNLTSPAWTNYNNGADLVAISKLQRFENVHIADLGSAPPAAGGMARPGIQNGADSTSLSYNVGNAGCVSVTPFAWPLGSSLSPGQQQYLFTKVVYFDPQGVARIQGPNTADAAPQRIEVALQPTHGNINPAPPSNQNAGNQAAIQIDAINGATRVYRP